MQRIWGTDAKEVTEQSGVEEVQLGGFHHPLPVVSVMGAEEQDQEARFQNRDPAPRRRMGHTRIRCQRRYVQQLAVPTGGETQEPTEGLEVPDVDDVADVPLDVRTVVIGEPSSGIESAIMDSRVRTCEQHPHQVRPLDDTAAWNPPPDG